MFNKERDKSLEASVPDKAILYRIEIKKLPIAAYFKFTQKMSEFIPDLVDSIFPDQKPADVLNAFKTATGDYVVSLLPVLPLRPRSFWRHSPALQA